MKRLIIYIFFSLLDSADSACPEGGSNNNQPQFGPGCMYRCHCVEDVQCDYITGTCPKGCAAGWMGPGCQYGDIAYNKQVQQLLYGSNLVIDGRQATDGLPTTCIGPATWVEIDLNAAYRISGLVINSRYAKRLSGFSVSFATNRSFNLVFKYPEKTPPLITEVMTLSEKYAQQVEISLNNTNVVPLTLCEVFVFGDCQDDMCGWTCDIVCHCDVPIAKQNMIDANCSSGCKTGWWGHSCNNTCHSNCKGNICNQSDGYCLECSQGKWSHFCDNNCTNCLQGTGCGASDGICSVGCLTGYFGISCGDHCGQCAADGSCDRYTGACIHGCQPGWQEENCTVGLQQEKISAESSSSLPIGIPVGGALGALGLTVLITVVGIIYWKRSKRAPETSEMEHTYDQIESTRAIQEKLSDYSKIDEMGLSPVIPKRTKYENTLSEKNLIPKCEFRDHYQHLISLDDKTGELRMLSVFKSIPSPSTTKTEVTRTGRADDSIKILNKSYLFKANGKKEFTILSDFTTTSEAIWRLALEHRIHLIIIIGEYRIPLKPKVQIDIGLIQMECIDITVEMDFLLCNINLSECEKDTKMRNVQVILSAEGSSFCTPSNINETLAVLKKRLWLRRGIEAFNTLINCTPEAADAECFIASLLMTDDMERSGYIDINGIIEAMRKEKQDAINSFDKFKFCHDVIFNWIVYEDNKQRM